MYRVTKRDGSITEFHIAKIGNAITRAFEAVGRQQHPSVIELLALRVTAEFEPKIRNELILSILPFGTAAASEYGEIRAYLQRSGAPIGPLDMLIAAHTWRQHPDRRRRRTSA